MSILLRSFFTVSFGFSAGGAFGQTGACQEITHAEFIAKSADMKGKEAVAFASWCSSCKPKILKVRENPTMFVLIAAFDDKESAEKVLHNWKIEAPCYFGEDLIKGLGIKSLPWSKKFD